MGDKTTITIPGWQSISYFSDITNICWFLEPEFAKEVVRLHNVVGNAVTKGRYIVVGTGSSQLILAAFYALSPPDAPEPINVLSASPYYSSYPSMTDFQKSGLYKWGGDAKSFDKDGPYIELVTSPNNPDGHTRQPVVNRSDGILIHDLAYYWPHYTPISTTSDHDITLFTVSKSTGHAGMRIGWALVKDQEVAKGMTKFIELNTIGVSKDSQLRAAKVLKLVSDSTEQEKSQELSFFKYSYEIMEQSWALVKDQEVAKGMTKFIELNTIGVSKDSQLRAAKVLKLVSDSTEQEKSQELSFFKYSYEIMEQRWKQLRASVEANGLFTLPNFPPEFCTFFNKETENLPAFAWMKCEKDIEDCQSFLGEHRILSRGGKHFGVSQRYVRVSMLDTDENFNLFINRLSAMQI
ncbi:hypothetical protein TanjilG_27565 [Lupinus angustifolius]|uniref:Alliinase C-terminal domain-containing protein n=1 Tax=Lupinus angustifolius TaxID=3871 RepID=A0A4P1R3E6_LUPAN|nr:hypothetical protein TanjilG_27565 [Lupinus angustifolius]